MKWVKKGFIFKAAGQRDWMNCYTTPIAVVELDLKLRIFFSTRTPKDNNGNFISNCSFLDVDKKDPAKILYIHNEPLLKLGEPGCFDEFGIMVAKPAFFNDKIYMYYMGWQRLSNESVPYQVMLGLAISEDDGLTFKKISKGPIMGLDYYDPISIGNVSIVIEDSIWKMWYTTFTKWGIEGIKPTPEYVIKYTESQDGVFWKKENIIAINEDENGGVATPSVIKINNKYHMWFGYRPPYDKNGNIHGYSIGYATSHDGKEWDRRDEDAGISTSETGWDSKMICYPHVIKVDDRYLLFYCGNGFGLDGFGYAELKGNVL